MTEESKWIRFHVGDIVTVFDMGAETGKYLVTGAVGTARERVREHFQLKRELMEGDIYALNLAKNSVERIKFPKSTLGILRGIHFEVVRFDTGVIEVFSPTAKPLLTEV